jgi:hypothetical protein
MERTSVSLDQQRTNPARAIAMVIEPACNLIGRFAPTADIRQSDVMEHRRFRNSFGNCTFLMSGTPRRRRATDNGYPKARPANAHLTALVELLRAENPERTFTSY